MNEYDLLGLMDTHKQMKAQGIDVPDTFAEFLTGIQPLDTGENVITPQIKQGDTTYAEAVGDVKQRASQAEYITNDLGVGTSRLGLKHMSQFIPGDNRPAPEHADAMEQGERLRTRQEIGYDPM